MSDPGAQSASHDADVAKDDADGNLDALLSGAYASPRRATSAATSSSSSSLTTRRAALADASVGLAAHVQSLGWEEREFSDVVVSALGKVRRVAMKRRASGVAMKRRASSRRVRPILRDVDATAELNNAVATTRPPAPRASPMGPWAERCAGRSEVLKDRRSPRRRRRMGTSVIPRPSRLTPPLLRPPRPPRRSTRCIVSSSRARRTSPRSCAARGSTRRRRRSPCASTTSATSSTWTRWRRRWGFCTTNRRR